MKFRVAFHSPCTPDCPWTHNNPALTSQVLELQACVTMTISHFLKNRKWSIWSENQEYKCQTLYNGYLSYDLRLFYSFVDDGCLCLCGEDGHGPVCHLVWSLWTEAKFCWTLLFANGIVFKQKNLRTEVLLYF